MIPDHDHGCNPFIGTTTDTKARGVNVPGYKGQTFDWRAGRDRTQNSYRVEASMTLRRWADASTTRFPGDEFLVPYSILGPDGKRLAQSPRVCKASLPWLAEQGYRVEASCIFIDIDNPGHRPWTDEDRERAHVEHATIDLLKPCGFYWTRSGRRLVQPLDRVLEMAEFEASVHGFLLQLERAGVAGLDYACRDWTRYFRLPYVVRDRVAVEPEECGYRGMAAIPPPLAVMPTRVRQRTAGAKSSTATSAAPVAMVSDLNWSTEVPLAYTQLALDLAAALLTREEAWHEVFLALGGALCERGVAAEHVPAIVRGVSRETRADDRTESREAQARETVLKRLSGLPIAAMKKLRALDPRLAVILERHTATKIEAQIRAATTDTASGETTLEQATTGMERSIEAAFGVVGVEAGCGMGKSQAALAVAARRSAKQHVDPDASGARAPAGSKTSLSCPTNSLAIQHTENLRRRGLKVLRLFGPLSQLNADGSYVCHYGESAKHLVAGGQSQQWELCEGRKKTRCDHYDGCTARLGQEGPSDARIVVGPHAKMATLSGAAGTSGLLILDEPPQAIKRHGFTLADFDALIASENDFTARYWSVLLPMIQAARYTLEHCDPTPINEPYCASALVWHGWPGLAPGVVEACLEGAGMEHDAGDPLLHEKIVAAQQHALPADAKGRAPSLRAVSVAMARRYPPVAERIGRASALAQTLWIAATQTPLASIRISDFAGQRELVFALLLADYVETLKRTGPTVLLDASLASHAPVASKVVGYQIPVHRYYAPDGCPVERTLFLEPRAKRKTWLRDGWPAWEEGLASALEAIVEWANDRPWVRSAALITVSPVAAAIRVALGGEPPLGMPQEVADAARATAGGILSRSQCRWMVGHYGAMRGLDAMAGCDALATLMDPIPNLADVQHDAAYYELAYDWTEYLQMLTRAELEQAHGRLRLVHREHQAAVAHVGSELPGGYGWSSPDVVIRREGFRRRLPPMAAADLEGLMRRLGISTSEFATRLGMPARTARSYLAGERAVPEHVADAVRRLDDAAKG